MTYFIMAYLVAVPLAYKFMVELRPLQELSFHVMGCLLIFAGMCFENRRIKIDKFLISIAGFGAVMLFVFIHRGFGWDIFFNGFLGITIFFTLCRTLKKENISKVITCISWIAFGAIIYKLFQELGWDMRRQLVTKQEGLVPDCSFFGFKAVLGMYLACAVPLILGHSWTVVNRFVELNGSRLKRVGIVLLNILIAFLAVLTILILLVSVGVSYSTGAVAGAVVSVLFVLWFKKRVIFWCVLIPIIMGSVLFVTKLDNPMGMQKSRLVMWGKVIQDSFDEPLGHGLDSFRNPMTQIDEQKEVTRYFKHSFNDNTVRVAKTFIVTDVGVVDWRTIDTTSQDEQTEFKERNKDGQPTLDFWDNPHNEFVWTFYELGYPGIIALGIAIILFCRRFWRSTKDVYAVCSTGAILAFGIFSLTQFGVHLARIGHLLPVLGAIFFVSTEDNG
uniref:Putative O-antigen ligase n=1 Tax=viral metagenome TaxID=1070528 RepID=A0A6M3J4K8_9ZZZZ